MSVNRGRQALPFGLDPVVAVVIQIFNEVQFEVFHEAELLQIQQFTFEQPEGIFYHSIVQAVTPFGSCSAGWILSTAWHNVLYFMVILLRRQMGTTRWIKIYSRRPRLLQPPNPALVRMV